MNRFSVLRTVISQIRQALIQDYWGRIKIEAQYFLQCNLKKEDAPTVITDIHSVADEHKWYYCTGHGEIIQQRACSYTIVEETKEIIRNGHSYLNELGRLWGGLPSKQAIKQAEMYYSHLHAVTHYPIYETFVCKIPDVWIANPTGVMVTAQNEILAQSVFDGFLTKSVLVNLKGLSRTQKLLPGYYLSLVGKWTNGYAHWLLDALPKLDLVDNTNYELKIILPTAPKPYQYDALQLLGIPHDRVIEMSGDAIRVEACLLSHAAQRTGVPSATHLLNVRNRLLQAAVTQECPPKQRRRLYVSRAKARRPLVNEEQLMPILRDYGFETIFCEDLSFADQIKLFAEADVVLGAHGAGMHNSMFCPQNSTVIEIFNRTRWDHTVCRLVSLVGHQHWHLFGKNVGKDWGTLVDITKLEKVLSYALETNFTIYDEPY